MMAKSQSYESSTLKLTTEQKEYAAKVLNESDENRETAIAEIKRWIEETDLRARTDDLFILRFLRVCKFNLEKTKIKMRNYQIHRAQIPEWFANRDPLQPRLQELLDLGICLPLRKLDNQGRLIILVRDGYNLDMFTIVDAIKASSMSLDLALRDSVEASLYGVVIIVDLQYTTLRHVAQARPSIVMNLVHSGQNCYPMRVQSFNYINIPETMRDCFTNIPDNILPVEYGGTDGTIQELTEYWKKTIEENRDWFIDDEKYKPILK